MPPLIKALVLSWLLMASLMAHLWHRQIKTQNANSVDAAWAMGFSGCALIGLSIFAHEWKSLLICLLVCAWSLRLGFYLMTTRVLNKKPEDARYRRLRTENNCGPKAFFIMYQFQALLVVLLSIAFFSAMAQQPTEFKTWDFIAILVWCIAIIGETTADRQLHSFLQVTANQGKTCQRGLWKYSRHPNYFFEWLHWWTYVFFAIGSDYFALSFVGPLLMLWFLLKVTGIPATERQALRSRRDYAEYQRQTSAFIPWFRKR